VWAGTNPAQNTTIRLFNDAVSVAQVAKSVEGRREYDRGKVQYISHGDHGFRFHVPETTIKLTRSVPTPIFNKR
jgi:hypothetical protein